MSRRATFATFAALAAALPCAALPLGLRLTQAAVTQAASAKEKDPLLMTEEEAYAAYAPDTAFVIDLDIVGTNTISLNPAQHGVGNSYIKIDWGDGTVEENCYCHYHGTEHSHTYAKRGRYVIRTGAISNVFYERETKLSVLRVLRWADFPEGTKITGGLYNCKTVTAFPDGSLARWPEGVTSLASVYYGCTGLNVAKLPEWPSGATSLASVYYGCTGLNVAKLPEWPSGATSLSGVYGGCTGLNVTKLPEWPKTLKVLTGHGGWDRGFYTGAGIRVEKPLDWPEGLEEIWGCVYDGCVNIKGPVPKWPSSLKVLDLPDYNTYNRRGVYYGCSGLTGEPPEWPDGLTVANFVYNGCSGLTGNFPQDWKNVTEAWETFMYCSGLTGKIPEWGAKVTNASQTFGGCKGLAGEVPSDWKNVEKAYGTFSSCPSLTGLIPAWGAAIKDAAYCYQYCKGLTGAWTDDPAELMPTNITSHGNCVSGASDAVRSLFYSDWGGYKEKPTE